MFSRGPVTLRSFQSRALGSRILPKESLTGRTAGRSGLLTHCGTVAQALRSLLLASWVRQLVTVQGRTAFTHLCPTVGLPRCGRNLRLARHHDTGVRV